VLPKFEQFFGLPSDLLCILATVPLLFVIYDFYCCLKTHISLSKSVKVIAILNLMYCGLSIGLALHHSQDITIWGWLYVIVEIIIVTSLAFFELKIAQGLLPRGR